MKRTVPLLIVFISAMVMICSHFIPPAVSWKEDVAVWFDILAAIAFVLGGGNLLKMNLQKISNQKPGWGYAAVVLVAFVVTLVIGMIKLGSPPRRENGTAWLEHGTSFARRIS